MNRVAHTSPQKGTSPKQGNLFVISGPSGAGKGTLVSRIVQTIPKCYLSISATTRAPRPGEIDGIHYYFLSKDAFRASIDKGEFLEWAYYEGSGNYYGTPAAAVRQKIAEGFQVILEIEVQGALQVKKNCPEALLIFIEPPSMEELERRLNARGTESQDVIITRMQTARRELSHKMEYNVRLVNDDLDCAVRELTGIMQRFIDGSETKDREHL